MTEKEMVRRWPHVRLDQLETIEMMSPDTLDLLNTMAYNAEILHGWRHRINSSYRDGDDGQHGLGKAVDLVLYHHTPGDVDVMQQLLFALRFDWTGIGYYPYWYTPGIHVDTRTLEQPYKAMWWRDKNGTYHAGDLTGNHLLWT